MDEVGCGGSGRSGAPQSSSSDLRPSSRGTDKRFDALGLEKPSPDRPTDPHPTSAPRPVQKLRRRRATRERKYSVQAFFGYLKRFVKIVAMKRAMTAERRGQAIRGRDAREVIVAARLGARPNGQ